ncbi:MAG TPA: DHH family phosphoesterase [Candidatus Choladousia intestinigallinarum]|nr:DHH family phosphoesterase [Candidatus Choladousia intestinigallinarum]
MKTKKEKLQMKYSGHVMRHWYWCVVMTLLLCVLTGMVLYVNTLAGCLVAGFTVVFYLAMIGLELYYRPKVLQELLDFTGRYRQIEREMLKGMAIPYGIIQQDGKLLWMNEAMALMTGKPEDCHKNISSLIPQLSADSFSVEEEEKDVEIEYGDRRYRVKIKKIFLNELLEEAQAANIVAGEGWIMALHFFDVTELSLYVQENYEERPVVGLLYMDNYDEAMESVEDVRSSMLEALVDRRITKYVTSMDGLIKKLEKDKYLLVVNQKGLDQMIQDRFSVLEDVKTVNIGNSISVTISIGVGVDSGGYCQDYEAARGAMEMALARGGDQAVVKDQNKMTFYGGKTQRQEKNTRVRARVKAQALRELISSRERVIVMGHKNTDIDSLGASVGVCRAALQAGKHAHICLGEINSGIRPWVNALQASGDYEDNYILTHDQAIELTNQNTVVVVVDTNRPSMAECSELLDRTKTIVVMDHHRQSEEKIENAALSYIEPSASSACEMIAEILQYYDDDVKLKVNEADCIYAGIIVDTNNFVAKTGMRTFEAAAFLRRHGADVTRVRKSFREDMDTYKAKAEAVRHAEAFMGRYAISVCPSHGLENATVVGAQAANELLNIIGVKASFVLTDYKNKIYISARAIDEVNVQIIMERLGGGGHMTIAGAQLEGVTVDEAKERLKQILTQMTEEGAI